MPFADNIRRRIYGSMRSFLTHKALLTKAFILLEPEFPLCHVFTQCNHHFINIELNMSQHNNDNCGGSRSDPSSLIKLRKNSTKFISFDGILRELFGGSLMNL